MFLSLRVVVQMVGLIIVECRSENKTGFSKLTKEIVHGNDNFYKELLNNIRRERDFESILVVHHRHLDNLRIQSLYEIDLPKIIITQSQIVNYKKHFNSEILAILVVDSQWDKELLETLAVTLDYMRQTRVLLIILNGENSTSFIEMLLSSCEKFKMTNVFLYIYNPKTPTVEWYYSLKPYPQYHLEALNANIHNHSFYPINWRNMQNTTIKTLPDQYVQFSMTYLDDKGQLSYNGVAARLVLLFAETFNASLQLAYPIKPGEVIHITQFVNLTQQGIVDIPMSLYVGFRPGIWTRMVYPLEIGTWMVVVPNSKRMEHMEVFTIVVSKYAYGLILVSVILFSVVHSASIYVSEGRINYINIFMNDNVIPGILGQSFQLMLSSVWSVKIIYFLIFLLGLNLNTGFSAYLNHLLTSPPFHRQIETFADLRNSKVKILFDSNDVANENTELMQLMEGSVVFTANTSYYQNYRNSLNDCYGYTIATTLWDLLVQQQRYFGQRNFHSPRDLIYRASSVSIILAENSPFKEPLNYLIHRVHQGGLRTAWLSGTFLDMIKYGKVIVSNSTPNSFYRVLNAHDLRWAWNALLIGHVISVIMFLAELIVAYYLKRRSLPVESL